MTQHLQTSRELKTESADGAASTQDLPQGANDNTTAANGTAADKESSFVTKYTPQWIKDISHSIDQKVQKARKASLQATPAIIENNITNILGAAHVGTEMIMFKSSLKGGDIVEGSKGPLHDITYFPKALKRVFGESVVNSGKDSAEIKAALKGNPIKGFFNYIKDVETATDREVKAQVGTFNKKNEMITREMVSLGNPWQTRSTLSGLIVWALSAVIPDRKESSDEIEHMAILRATNKPAYVAERFKQAVWVPDWFHGHKRQMIGLGIMISGICSTLGSWRNNTIAEVLNAEGALVKGKVYTLNKSYLATSALTFISSLPLLFAVDDQKGYNSFGAWMTGRLVFLPTSIAKKFTGDKKGAWAYTGATVGFQLENWTQALIGGAEKLPDGTIVDHEAARKNAKLKIEEIRALEKNKELGPTLQISNVSHHARALPEHLAAQEQQKSAATV